MNKMSWFKHPRDLSNDKRMSLLINLEGGKGYGTYLYIIETLFMQPDKRLNFCQLVTMHRKGFGKKYMERIIRNYKLFTIRGEEFESTINYGQTKNSAETSENSSENLPAIAPETLNAEQNREKYGECERIGSLLTINELTDNASLAYTREEKKRKEKKRAEAEQEEKETPAAAATSSSLSSSFGEIRQPLQPVRPWQELVDHLSQNSSWLEIACMKSSYGALLRRCLPEALKVFKQHIEAYGKGEGLLKMSDVYGYFINFVRAGSRTSQDLRTALLAYEAGQQTHPAATDNLYRYEQRIDGHRFYLGCPIPSEAPPRPDKNAIWNEELQIWMAGSRPKPATRTQPDQTE